MKNTAALWMGLFAAASALAFADECAMEKVGDQWKPMKANPNVRLLKVNTSVKLIGNLDKSNPNSTGYSDVTTVLTLKNDIGAQTVWIGLPEMGRSDEQSLNILHNVKVLVNNKKTTTERLLTTGCRYYAYWISPVTLPVKGIQTVKITYQRPLFSDQKGYAYEYPAEVVSNWKGRIVSSKLTIDTSKLSGYKNPTFFPLPSDHVGKMLVWSNENYKPTESQNIYATFESRGQAAALQPTTTQPSTTQPTTSESSNSESPAPTK